MSQVAAEKRIALVIGNAAYEAAAALANPVNDALQMAGALERLGFDVMFGYDCDINEFDKRLREFTRKLVGSDVGLLYYSGHALQLDGENYLIPIDARLVEADLERRAFKVSMYLAEMRNATQVSIVFLDSCRDNPFSLDDAGRSAGTKKVFVRRTGLKEIEKDDLRGALIAFAAEEGRTAADGPEGGLSPFTQALVDHIETPGLEVIEMMRLVRRSVLEATKGKQTPWSNQSLTNEFFFKPLVVPVIRIGPDITVFESDKRKGVESSQPPVQKGEYVVWFGTNRRRLERDATKGFSSGRDHTVHYGSCRVYIPKSHKIGSIGSPWWRRWFAGNDDRLHLVKISEFNERSFWGQIARRLEGVTADERQALIFLHGYNVSFQEAALRAAQIGFDLSIKGIMAFFSWPSQGTVAGYMADAATIEASEDDITNFMTNFVTQSGAESVNIIAHSMGNRGLLRAVNRIAHRAEAQSRVPFGQIILAAADVDADSFRTLCKAYTQVAQRTTLYVSTRDRAVEASHWLHQFPRVGLMPPVCVAPGIDTIGVSNVDMTLLGHGYMAEAREVLNDMYQLIRTGSPPGRRFGLDVQKTKEGQQYWIIRA
jgi:esterase/lipase superfamily enzyme